MASSDSTPAPTAPCRGCGREVALDEWRCPNCDAPRPAMAHWEGEGYEWKSTRTWRGRPLLHIAFGQDRNGRVRTARGLIAIGQRAVGGVAIGIVARGILACGVVSMGVISVGVVSLALGCALGVNALGPVAFGVTPMGFVVGGLAPLGWKVVFSLTARSAG